MTLIRQLKYRIVSSVRTLAILAVIDQTTCLFAFIWGNNMLIDKQTRKYICFSNKTTSFYVIILVIYFLIARFDIIKMASY